MKGLSVNPSYVLWLGLLLFFSVCSPRDDRGTLPSIAETPPAQVPMPSGWALLPKPPSKNELNCANYSEKEWEITVQTDAPHITLRTPRKTVKELLPFEIKGGNTKNGLIGERHVKQVDDGWLVGFNAGEWGGSLFWFSSDGKEKRDLGALNTVDFIETSFGIFSINGVAHLGSDTGHVLRVFKDRHGRWNSEMFIDLMSAPHAVTNESPDSFLVLTNKRLVRIGRKKTVEPLTQTDYSDLYPTSMVRLSSGVVYAGMRLFVVRFIPKGDLYKEEWLLPDNCLQLRIADYDCRCKK